MSDRAEAQRRVNQIRAFGEELAALDREGVLPLSAEQAAVVAAHHERLLRQLAIQYDVDRSDAASRLSRGMQLLSFFAAVALTLSVYSLVSRFWGRLDLPAQAALLAAFPIAALGGVEMAARRERTLYIASLFALVAYGTFWLAIGILSWTLNISVTPVAIWAGVLFGVALALPFRFRLILALALTGLIVALAGTVFQSAGSEWTQAFERPEPLITAAFLSTFLGPRLAQVDSQFAPVVRLVGLSIGLGGLLLLSVNGRQSLLPIAAESAEAFYQAVMLVVTVACLVIAIRHAWRETVMLASVALALFLLTRYVDWLWDVLPRYVFFLLLALAAFGWLLALRRIRARFHEVRA
jgi:hypothetical protein